jgi:hypothetical protein
VASHCRHGLSIRTSGTHDTPLSDLLNVVGSLLWAGRVYVAFHTGRAVDAHIARPAVGPDIATLFMITLLSNFIHRVPPTTKIVGWRR